MTVIYTKLRVENGDIILERTTTNIREITKTDILEQLNGDLQIIEDDIVRLQTELSEKEALKLTITNIKQKYEILNTRREATNGAITNYQEISQHYLETNHIR